MLELKKTHSMSYEGEVKMAQEGMIAWIPLVNSTYQVISVLLH